MDRVKEVSDWDAGTLSIEMATFQVDSVPKKSSPLPHENLEQATRNRIGRVKPEAVSKTIRPTVFSGYSQLNRTLTKSTVNPKNLFAYSRAQR